MHRYLNYSNRIVKGFLTLICFCRLAFSIARQTAAAQDLEAYAVKAAYIFNLTKFIQWPEKSVSNDADVYHFFVFGNDDVEKQMKTIDGKNNGTGIIQVHHIDPRSIETDNAFSQSVQRTADDTPSGVCLLRVGIMITLQMVSLDVSFSSCFPLPAFL